MEDIEIEYLDEYKDLVLPGVNSSPDGVEAATAAASLHQAATSSPRRRRISSGSSDSSSLDPDIFQKLFDGKFLDDELLDESGSNVKGRSQRSLSCSSSDSNDALDALYNRQIGKSKNTRVDRLESFDSLDDLGAVLMGSNHKLSQSKTDSSRKEQKVKSVVKSKSTDAKTYANKPSTSSIFKTKDAALNHRINGNSSSSSSSNHHLPANKKRGVTIVKSQSPNSKSSKSDPRCDPLHLQDLPCDSDSDSSFEYESDFYGDDSDDDGAQPRQVIDISTDTSVTTSAADTVTPVVSDDEDSSDQHQQHNNTPNGKAERLKFYLDNLSSAETPPTPPSKQKSSRYDRKSRSNDKKSSSPSCTKVLESSGIGQVLAEDERQLEEPSGSTGPRRLFDDVESNDMPRADYVDDNLTYETLERLSLDLTEQIKSIEAERSIEFDKRSHSKSRSNSTSHAWGSFLSGSHVRKLTYSHESLDRVGYKKTKLRRAQSEGAFPKGKRTRQTKKRAKTIEERKSNVPLSPNKSPDIEELKPSNETHVENSEEKETEVERKTEIELETQKDPVAIPKPEVVKRKRGRPRKNNKKFPAITEKSDSVPTDNNINTSLRVESKIESMETDKGIEDSVLPTEPANPADCENNSDIKLPEYCQANVIFGTEIEIMEHSLISGALMQLETSSEAIESATEVLANVNVLDVLAEDSQSYENAGEMSLTDSVEQSSRTLSVDECNDSASVAQCVYGEKEQTDNQLPVEVDRIISEKIKSFTMEEALNKNVSENISISEQNVEMESCLPEGIELAEIISEQIELPAEQVSAQEIERTASPAVEEMMPLSQESNEDEIVQETVKEKNISEVKSTEVISNPIEKDLEAQVALNMDTNATEELQTEPSTSVLAEATTEEKDISHKKRRSHKKKHSSKHSPRLERKSRSAKRNLRDDMNTSFSNSPSLTENENEGKERKDTQSESEERKDSENKSQERKDKIDKKTKKSKVDDKNCTTEQSVQPSTSSASEINVKLVPNTTEEKDISIASPKVNESSSSTKRKSRSKGRKKSESKSTESKLLDSTLDSDNKDGATSEVNPSTSKEQLTNDNATTSIKETIVTDNTNDIKESRRTKRKSKSGSSRSKRTETKILESDASCGTTVSQDNPATSQEQASSSTDSINPSVMVESNVKDNQSSKGKSRKTKTKSDKTKTQLEETEVQLSNSISQDYVELQTGADVPKDKTVPADTEMETVESSDTIEVTETTAGNQMLPPNEPNAENQSEAEVEEEISESKTDEPEETVVAQKKDIPETSAALESIVEPANPVRQRSALPRELSGLLPDVIGTEGRTTRSRASTPATPRVKSREKSAKEQDKKRQTPKKDGREASKSKERPRKSEKEVKGDNSQLELAKKETLSQKMKSVKKNRPGPKNKRAARSEMESLETTTEAIDSSTPLKTDSSVANTSDISSSSSATRQLRVRIRRFELNPKQLEKDLAEAHALQMVDASKTSEKPVEHNMEQTTEQASIAEEIATPTQQATIAAPTEPVENLLNVKTAEGGNINIVAVESEIKSLSVEQICNETNKISDQTEDEPNDKANKCEESTESGAQESETKMESVDTDYKPLEETPVEPQQSEMESAKSEDQQSECDLETIVEPLQTQAENKIDQVNPSATETTGVQNSNKDDDVRSEQTLWQREADDSQSDGAARYKLKMQGKSPMAPPPAPERDLTTGKSSLRRQIKPIEMDMPHAEKRRRIEASSYDKHEASPSAVVRTKSGLSFRSPTIVQGVRGKKPETSQSPMKSTLSSLLAGDDDDVVEPRVKNSVIITQTKISPVQELLKKTDPVSPSSSGINISVSVLPEAVSPPKKLLTQAETAKKMLAMPTKAESAKKTLAMLTTASTEGAKKSQSMSMKTTTGKTVAQAVKKSLGLSPKVIVGTKTVKKMPVAPSARGEDKSSPAMQTSKTLKSRKAETVKRNVPPTKIDTSMPPEEERRTVQTTATDAGKKSMTQSDKRKKTEKPEKPERKSMPQTQTKILDAAKNESPSTEASTSQKAKATAANQKAAATAGSQKATTTMGTLPAAKHYMKKELPKEPRKSAGKTKDKQSLDAAVDQADTSETPDKSIKRNSRIVKTKTLPEKQDSSVPHAMTQEALVDRAVGSASRESSGERSKRAVRVTKAITAPRAASSSRAVAAPTAPIQTSNLLNQQPPLPQRQPKKNQKKPAAAAQELNQSQDQSQARKRKLPATTATETVSAKRAKQQQQVEKPATSIAFPVRITAATAVIPAQVPLVRSDHLVSKPQTPFKLRKLRVRINRSVVKNWLANQQQQRQQQAPPIQQQHKKPVQQLPAAVAPPSTAPLARTVVPPSAVPLRQLKPVPLPAKAVPLPLPLLVVKEEHVSIEEQQEPPNILSQLPDPLEAPLPVEAPIPSAPINSTTIQLSSTSMPMDDSLANLASSSSAAPNSRSNSSEVPPPSASSGDVSTFGTTKMFSFLYPSRYQRSYSQVGLDFCCPNLDGPMPAIDPTRLHAKAEVPVLELPQYMVISTKIISKQDKNIPQKVRAKLEQMAGKDGFPCVVQTMQMSSTEPEAPTAAVVAPAAAPAASIVVASTASLMPAAPVVSAAPVPNAQPVVAKPTAQPVVAKPALRLAKQPPQPQLILRGSNTSTKVNPPAAASSPAAVAPAVARAPTAATSSGGNDSAWPELLQLPTICPHDKVRVELQDRVQLFDVVLQNLARRVTSMTVTERQRIIENIVKTSTLLPIDVDVGTKLLENYTYYLNDAADSNNTVHLPNLRSDIMIAKPSTSKPAASTPASSKTSTVPAAVTSNSPLVVPPDRAGMQARPIFDKNRKIIGYQYKPTRTSTPRNKLAVSEVSPAIATRATPRAGSSTTAPFRPEPHELRTNTRNKKSTQMLAGTGTSKASPVAVDNVLRSSAHTAKAPTVESNRNLFIVNQVLSQPEECILPDAILTSDFRAEVKGEIDDVEMLV